LRLLATDRPADRGAERVGSLCCSITSRLFDIAVPENNLFGTPAGSGPAMANGWFFVLAPLPKGHHTIRVAYQVVEVPGTLRPRRGGWHTVRKLKPCDACRTT
jgi:hypothetical protein